MSDRLRERKILVDRDVLEEELRKLAEIECIWQHDSPCPQEWPNTLDQWCVGCTARRVLAAAESETA